MQLIGALLEERALIGPLGVRLECGARLRQGGGKLLRYEMQGLRSDIAHRSSTGRRYARAPAPLAFRNLPAPPALALPGPAAPAPPAAPPALGGSLPLPACPATVSPASVVVPAP